jgi:ABC-type multidrug transport system ATPase subunit
MTEKTLESLIRLLTLLALTRPNTTLKIEKDLVVSFLLSQFDKEIIDQYEKLFEEYYKKYSKDNEIAKNISGKINLLTEEMCDFLQYRQRIYLIVSLFEFSKYLKEIFERDNTSADYFGYISRIGERFNIDSGVLKNLKSITLNEFHLLEDKEKLLVIVDQELPFIKNLNQVVYKGIKGKIYVLKTHSDFFLIKYVGSEIYYIDKKILKKDIVYVFSIISAIIIDNRNSIYFNDIQEGFALKKGSSKFYFVIKDVEFSYNNIAGIKKFNFACESGELIGILGSSGSGKTTLLNLLNGNLPVSSGEILLDGEKLNTELIKNGRFGYVPQDDLLYNELTVFQNLYYNTVLCQNLSMEKIKSKINEILELFGIFEISELLISSPEKNIISGGQRKRLNIASELIREPDVIFIDEPTSGLSSSDSWRIMNILKHLSLKNKIVFVNIHQPTDAVFHLFDKIIILDRGGYPIYAGRPKSALEYFKNISGIIQQKVSIQQSEQEEILSIVEEPFIDEFGNNTNLRKIEPKTWYKHFLEQKNTIPEDIKTTGKIKERPKTVLPGSLRQFRAYFMRNFLAKISNKQYRIVSLIIAPVLAFVLSFLCKDFSINGSGHSYNFLDNDNLPGFYFMSIIAVSFIGLMTSAEDIFKDNKVRIRERYLSLNSTSYYFSKIVLLFAISLLQTLLYASISAVVLHLYSGFIVYWVTLFLVSFLSNIIGLMISSILNSLVTIYILIPIVLIPQILLSGVVVKYEKLHPIVSSEEFVPVVGDIMPSRWAFELLVVNQFKNNRYQSEIFEMEKNESMLSFVVYTQIPQIQVALNEYNHQHNRKLLPKDKKQYEIFILNELEKVNDKLIDFPSIKINKYSNILSVDSINLYLERLKRNAGAYLQKVMYATELRKNQLMSDDIYRNNFNHSIASLAKNSNQLNSYKIIRNEIVQLSEPIYVTPYNKFGRALFYSSEKRIGAYYLDTVLYNFMVIIFMIFVGILIINSELLYKIKNLLILK